MQAAGLSHDERDRRYAALREAMAAAELDALLICARGDEFQRGRLSYVSNLYMWAGRGFALLPREHPPTVVQARSIAWAEAAGWVEDNRSAVEPAAAVAEALLEHGLGQGRIGIVGMADVLALHDLRVLRHHAPDARYVDATVVFDRVRAIKSPAEIDCLRETSRILTQAYHAIEAVLAPGVTERQVVAEAQRVARLFGCLDGIAHLSRSTGLAMMHPPTGQTITREDAVTFDLEFAGPQGYWLELSRQYSFGPPAEQLRRIYEVQVAAFERCVELIRPGVRSTEIAAAAAEVYRARGFTPAGPVGYHAHGIGLDSLELPLVPGDDIALEAGMVLSLHPHVHVDEPGIPSIAIQDNVLVTQAGCERLTDSATSWIEL